MEIRKSLVPEEAAGGRSPSTAAVEDSVFLELRLAQDDIAPQSNQEEWGGELVLGQDSLIALLQAQGVTGLRFGEIQGKPPPSFSTA
ncbi:Neurogenic Locus Notch-like Protein 1 [Manis pentadactyla]|nr:Neurogenic Locus Notch-like Protein 1 [Manis pentadactyla]